MKTEQLAKLAINDIVIEGRFRKEGKDAADVRGLAASINKLGLLQPIGVTPDNKLVFGERRIRALQYLGQQTVLARVVDVNSLLEAELDENEHRLPFTASERLAIADAIEREMGERRGRPQSENVRNCAHLNDGRKTRDVAAEKAGFANASEYGRVQTVVEQGTPELVQAMDAGAVSVSAAAAVAGLPPEEQQAAVAAGPQAVKAAAKALREARAKPVAAKKASKESVAPSSVHIDNEQPHEVIALRDKVAALDAQIAKLQDDLAEMTVMAEQTLNDNVTMGKVFDADDRLAMAVAQLKIETEVCRVTRIRLDGFMHEKNEVIRAAKGYKLRAERAERELAALRKQMTAAA